jgi:hypothetical protein
LTWTTTDKLLLSGLLPSSASRRRLRRLLDERGEEIDWPATLRRAEAGGIAALLRFNLVALQALDCAPRAVRERLDELDQLWTARHLAYTSEAVRLLEALSGAGITAFPLKGAALMLGGYYPRAGLRAAIDMDLLVDPVQIDRAERIAFECGYVEIEGRSQTPARQRLANELNHRWPRRGPAGLVLELHHRAFHYSAAGRSFGFTEVSAQASRWPGAAGATLLLPATEDLCLHLVHHTMVDLQSTSAILRTLADLYFIAERESGVLKRLEQRADGLGFGGAAQLARAALNLMTTGTLEDLDRAARGAEVTLLLETALLEQTAALAEAARLFEYLDLRRRPLGKLGNLCALVFTSRSHLAQLYGGPASGRAYLNYLRRPFDLLRKFNWASLAPANLRRVRRLRKMVSSKSRGSRIEDRR